MKEIFTGSRSTAELPRIVKLCWTYT